MLRIYLLTGLVYTQSIEVYGDMNSDIIELLDDYYKENGSLPVPMYTLDEVAEMYGKVEELDDVLNAMIPINGGEFYILGISHIEEI